MMEKLKLCLILGFLLGSINYSIALYEDQAGKFDWRHQYVGSVEHVAFDQCAQGMCKRIIVTTDQHVVASLSARSGDIEWRQIQEKSEHGRIDDVLLLDNNLMVALGGGTLLRCLSATVGNLHWEFNPERGDVKQRAQLTHLEHDDEKVIVMLASGVVYGLDVVGRLKWQQQLPNSDTLEYRYLKALDGVISVVGIATRSHVTIVTMDGEGTMLPKYTVPSAWIRGDTSCQFAGGQFMCLDADSGILHQAALLNPDMFKSSLLQDLGISCSDASLMNGVSDSPQGEFGVLCGRKGNSVMLQASDSGIKLVKDLPGVTAIQILRYGNQDIFITMARTETEECEMRGYQLSSGLELPEFFQKAPIASHHGRPGKLFGLVKKKESSPTFKVVIICQDDGVILFQQTGKLGWTREESLSKVVAVDMVDLPVSPILAKMEDEFGTESTDVVGMFARRLKTQLAQIQESLFHIRGRFFKSHKHTYTDGISESYLEQGDEDEDDDYLFRDDFNIKKVVILVTEAGKVYGLYSATGRILWRHLLTDMVPFESAGKKLFTISMQRTTSHFPHDPHCTLIGKHRESGEGMMFQFHPISGRPADGTSPGGDLLGYNVKQLMMISQMDDHFLHPLVVLDTEHKYHVYPEDDGDMVRGMAPTLFMMSCDTTTAQLQGFSITNNLEAQEVWSLNLASEQQTITNIVYKPALEHVHSQGIVLADRSVLYKYLNPNLVVITAEGVDSSQKGFLNVYLIDSVSGQLIFHCTHKKVKGPVHVVHSENWIVYDYWNQRHRRSEVAVLELYEGKKQSNATVFSSLYPPPLPMVLRQAYIFGAHITSMAATITEKGITNKHVLLALETGGVLEMHKALLDPRRPEVPTQEHREEGIIPYIPELPRQNEAIINYHQGVFLIRGIHTAPTGLESHSMVLCYGLDLFYTRVMPSKMFDMLKEDFDYFFIGSVTGGMILISLISKKLAIRKALNRAWK